MYKSLYEIFHYILYLYLSVILPLTGTGVSSSSDAKTATLPETLKAFFMISFVMTRA